MQQGKLIKLHEAKEGHTNIVSQKWKPQHFIDIADRVEAVWDILQQQGTKVVALVGRGGIGRKEFFFKCSWIGGLCVSIFSF